MSIENIKRLSMNTHFYSLLIQSFLTGYEKTCELKLVFMALPILIHKESREKLCNANINSRRNISTMFLGIRRPGKSRFCTSQRGAGDTGRT